MDAKFKVLTTFAFKGGVRRSDVILEVSEIVVKEEIAKGVHPETKRHMSGLLNHCVPDDDFTRNLLKGVQGIKLDVTEEEGDTDKEEEIKKLRAEFDKIGKSYHPTWRAARLRKELLKAQKEQPEKPLVEEKQKTEKVK